MRFRTNAPFSYLLAAQNYGHIVIHEQWILRISHVTKLCSIAPQIGNSEYRYGGVHSPNNVATQIMSRCMYFLQNINSALT
jgi:hypothetical protein